MKKYIPSQIEPKWQKKWREENINFTDLGEPEKKYYVLVELPYTSGDLHMGHWFTFTMGDIIARLKRRQGFNVLYPNGFDAFGLPGENAAIKKGIHPREWTYANIKRMREQYETMGASIDWDKTAITADPEYYKWNQWIFLKMLERGIAYRGKAVANWCPKDATVLADENIEDGKCWRCGTEVIKKEVEQWFLKLTEYADRLIWQDPPQTDWPKPLRVSQNEWIGKSEGALVEFGEIEVFTTRLDTIFGATFAVVSPEHSFVDSIESQEVKEYIRAAKKKSELERKEAKEKTGVFSGKYVKNPLTEEDVPVWVADYVLTGYGTGAVMGVPAHDKRDFEFAKKFNLPIKRVVAGGDLPYAGEGVLVNSGKYSGITSSQAREAMPGTKKVQYHLHDWSISRQRYWGTPIPVIHCQKCGIVPVPEKDLPVELPYKVDYTPKGKPPLATAEEWVRVKCPKCGGEASRDTETMDGFVDNSWYFYRYLDKNNNNEIFNKELMERWLPLEIYIGGAEHTVGHTLYSRFFTKFFHDIGLVSFDEYAKKRVHHGVILGPDGSRMSKSRGNVVNPDEEVKNYGADAIRLYLMFLGPFDIVAPWNPEGINGIYRFLQRIWGLPDKVTEGELDKKDLYQMHRTIKKVTQDLEELKFNTAIAVLMEWLNHLSRKEKVSKEEYKTYLLLLAPFAPHITEELWQQLQLSVLSDQLSDKCFSVVGSSGTEKQKTEKLESENRQQKTDIWSIHQHSFPEFDNKYLQEEKFSLVVQVNGKLRDTIMIDKDIVSNKESIAKMARKGNNAKKFLEGKTVKRVIYVEAKLINFVV